MANRVGYPTRRRDPEAALDDPPRGGLRVAGLERSYGSVKVLDGVSFEVPAGAVCTLLGSSGSGKTTTLRLLAGLDRPDAGDIYIGDRHVAGRGVMVPAERREVGMLFQSYALWPHMKVVDQIAYPLKLRKVGKAEATEAIESTAKILGISHLLDRYPSELSGGQQQRVGLARALVFGPGLLLLDEPLSGLDAALRRQTQLELRRLQERVGITTVYVTHDQEEAMSISDLVIVLSQGRVLSAAPPRQTYERPESVFVASFVGGSNTLEGTVAGIDGDRATIELADGSRITGVAPKPLTAGQTGFAAIKPVDAVVNSAGGADPNTVRGTVTSSTFLGAQVDIAVDVAGAEFRVLTQRSANFAAGEALRITLPVDCVTVLPPD
jgi:iron(III) transport system ATP-binding protein